jgi:hypothetical protein
MISDVKLALATGWIRATGYGEELTSEAARFLYYDFEDDLVETGMGFGNVNVLRQSMSDEQFDLRIPMQSQVEEAQRRGKEIREKIKAYMKKVYGTTGYSPLTEAYVTGLVTLGVLDQKFRLRMWGAKVGEEDAALAHLAAK